MRLRHHLIVLVLYAFAQRPALLTLGWRAPETGFEPDVLQGSAERDKQEKSDGYNHNGGTVYASGLHVPNIVSASRFCIGI
jgi:hypothetical protein